jgi:hypothetical protein
MPDKAINEELELWRNRVELAKRYMDKHGNTDDRWNVNIKAMAGDFNSKAELGDEAIDVNKVRSTIKTSLPPMWVIDPHVTVTPTVAEYKGKDNVRRAQATETEVNYWQKEIEVRQVVRKCLLDAEATNHAYAYVGFTRTQDEVEVDGERIENEFHIQPKKPFVRRISPRMVGVPPGYTELEECPWVDIKFAMRVKDVKLKWPNTTEDIQGETLDKDMLGVGSDDNFGEFLEGADCETVVIHNVWNKRDKKVYIFADTGDDFLEPPEEWPWDLEGFPLEHLNPEEVPDEYWGTPPTSFYLPQQKELNSNRTSMKSRRSRTKSTIWVSSDIPAETIELYKDGPDGQILKIDPDQKGNISGKIVIDPGLPFDQGDLVYDQVVKSDMKDAQGFSGEQTGAGDPNVRSATSSANIEKHVQVRSADRADQVKRFYLGIFKKLWMVLKTFPTSQKVQRLILGRDGQVLRRSAYTMGELHGEFGFDMDFSAMLADNPQNRAQQAILNYNLLRADPLVNPQALVQDIFDSQNKQQPERYIIALKTPDVEHNMMFQGLPVEANDRDNHEAHVSAHHRLQVQLTQGLSQGRTDPQSSDGEKIRLALILLTAHMQDHFRRVQGMQQQQGPQPGQPQDENQLRESQGAVRRDQARAAGETDAELNGNPLGTTQPQGSIQ